MTFITILVPAVIAAIGLFIVINFIGRKNETVGRKIVLSVGAVLMVAGCYFEFLVSPISMTEMMLRAVVLMSAVGVVVASEIAKGIEASCGSYRYSTGEVCNAVYSAKIVRTACTVMTLVLASIVAAA